MTSLMWRRYAAEFLGTFAYVFFGCGARIVVENGQNSVNNLLVYFTFGFTLFAMTFALSHISAAPFNPALTLGLAVAKRFPWRYVVPYSVAQIAGALLASSMHFFLFPHRAATARYGATVPSVSIVSALVIEAIMTFFLMLVTMASATDNRVNRAAIGLATGLTITFCGLFAAPLTGGSLNPARSLAPALFVGGNVLAIVWIYWVGPLSGAILAALVYEALRGGKEYGVETPKGIFDRIERKKG